MQFSHLEDSVFWVFRVATEAFTCLQRFCNYQHENLRHSLMRKTLNRSNWRPEKALVWVICYLLLSTFLAVTVTERVANKLRRFSTFKHSCGTAGYNIRKPRYDPRKDCLVYFDCVARKSLVSCLISQRHTVSSWFAFLNSRIAWYIVGEAPRISLSLLRARHKRGVCTVARLMSIRDVDLQGGHGDFTLSSKIGKIVSSSSKVRAVRTELKITWVRRI